MTVYLVGAGPGDPELLTVKAVRTLQSADVVLYDKLIDPRVLDLAPARARRIDVGKRCGRHAMSQAAINRLLVAQVRAGAHVVRLKGGDPFVFGRGGEEALALAAAGIPFRIVPGITAGVGGLAYAGIPTTHRDTNHTVAFVTGHASTGEVPDGIDWPALARASPVIVFYMALKHLGTITQNLLAAGRPAAEPVAIVSKATTDQQRVVETTLSRAVAEAVGVDPPAIVVVGEVVRLRAALDWLSPRAPTRSGHAG